jgi:hypothetical protein
VLLVVLYLVSSKCSGSTPPETAYKALKIYSSTPPETAYKALKIYSSTLTTDQAPIDE